jgi:NAD(P)-dependent dehydrogenase (short-subunit alcohol dehydrogenase family)
VVEPFEAASWMPTDGLRGHAIVAVIVTGVGGDLGTAITQRLITQGAHVLAVDFNTAELSRLVWGILETFIADVSDAEQVLGYATRCRCAS